MRRKAHVRFGGGSGETGQTKGRYRALLLPNPWSPGQEDQADPKVQAISEAARELVRLRDEWLALTPQPPLPGRERGSRGGDGGEGNRGGDGSSLQSPASSLKDRILTNLYNKRPDWLDLAHKRLDAAVFDAYGWPHGLSDDEILARLLALNLERAVEQGEGLVDDDQE